MASTDAGCAAVDDSFGPDAAGCRGGFDFTLLFEETVLTLLPLCIFLLAAPLRIYYLSRKARKVEKSFLLPVKLVSFAILGALNLSLLVLWVKPSTQRTRASIPTAVLGVLGPLVFCALSYLEHTRSVRPSSLLDTYLLLSLLFDIARTRTLWLRAGDAVSVVQTAATILKALLLLSETLEKRNLLKDEYKGYPPEAVSGIYNRFFFWWLNPLFRQGFSKLLSLDDLFVLDKHLGASRLHGKFEALWASLTNPTRLSLLKVAFTTLKWPLLRVIPPRAALIALNFCQPFLINRAISLSEGAINQESTNAGYGLIGAYFLVYVGIAVSMGQYQHSTYRAITMVRGGLISMIYRKTSGLKLNAADPSSSLTLMSADIERIVQGWQTMHELWANLVEIGVAIYLLERELGIACVVPVVVAVVSIGGSLFAMNFIVSKQALWLEAIEKRISATSSMLNSMKGIKMSGLKQTLFDNLQKLRVDELRISKQFRRLLIWNMIFAYVTQVFAPVLTFAIFSVIARQQGGSTTLDTARVFTSLSLFSLLSEPITSLVMALATFIGSVGCFARIQEFLTRDERVDERVHAVDFIEETMSKSPSLSIAEADKRSVSTMEGGSSSFRSSSVFTPRDAISICDGSFGWIAGKESLLKQICTSIPRQKMTMVIGPVGCGKSTFLKALLGEVPALSGQVSISSSSVAFCDQTPWHSNGTIRQSIVASSPVDQRWYSTVVRACALDVDFDYLPLGDETVIGSQGIALSGGQSQRIALARAVYAQKEIVIIDDALSGLDATTENFIFHSLLGQNGLLRLLHSTVIIASSSVKRLPYSDYIICIGDKGTICEQGRFSELSAGSGYVSTFSLPPPDWNYVPDDKQELLEPPLTPVASQDMPKLASTLDAEANRSTGDLSIYFYYVNSIGWWPIIIFVVAIIVFIFCISFPNIWVKWWAAANAINPNGRLEYWLTIYAGLGIIAIFGLFVSCWQMIINMVPASGERFHFTLLNTVLSAPMSFFVTTDSGVTMNRFSQDLQLIDMELPLAALNTFATFVLCIAQMVLIGVASIYAAVAFPIVLAALYLTQKFYLRTSRQLRFMDLEAKAPLYSQFSECLSGLATIRAFGWQTSMEEKNKELLDRSQRPFYLLFSVQRWLTLVLDLIVAAIAVILIVLVVQLRGTISAGYVGVALLNVIQFSQSIKLFVTFWTTLETHIGAVARVKIFSESVTSEDLPSENTPPPPAWPSAGAIEITNLSAAYRPGTRVLDNVSISIKAGEKIGVCGRTGSGKTSLALSLFRMIDLAGGSITIDGIDITSIPRQDLRSRVVGVSQDPFLLKGSVRVNADPSGSLSDTAIKNALKSVQLLLVVEEKGGLDVDIDELHLSNGQKQLFCLARAMLRPSPILVLDEATSNVDAKTEAIIQRLIRKKFSNHTIIAIAHKLETILDFDKVAVLDHGKLIEFDDPYALLGNEDSAFSKLYNIAMTEQLDDMVVEQGIATPWSVLSRRSTEGSDVISRRRSGSPKTG